MPAPLQELLLQALTEHSYKQLQQADRKTLVIKDMGKQVGRISSSAFVQY